MANYNGQFSYSPGVPPSPELAAQATVPVRNNYGGPLPGEPVSGNTIPQMRTGWQPTPIGVPYGPTPAPQRGLNVGAASMNYGASPPPAAGLAAPPPASVCNQCNDGSCDACRAAPAGAADCVDCPRWGFEAFQGFDTFRGPPDGAGPSNFGEVTGGNGALPLYQPWGIGWQLGASYGLYDFSGRTAPAPQVQTTGAQQQIFVTTGIFRRANNGQRWSWGFVHDWMINNNYSQYALSPTISQWRGQIEWAASGVNSFGVWGTFRDRSYIGDRPDNHNQFRTISQIDAFWHHKYAFGGDTWLRIGMPLSKRLASNALAGSAIIGATAQVPLNQQLAIYANAMYMAPNVAAGPQGPTREDYNVSMGLAWYPGRVARTPTVSGACWMPYMPLGNNGNFLVDTVHYD
ncbi:MAG TPA: DUF6666 family protein [Pirellulales bacterium]|nr:DUF6666 family protein [Pirellulales bacterium]